MLLETLAQREDRLSWGKLVYIKDLTGGFNVHKSERYISSTAVVAMIGGMSFPTPKVDGRLYS